MSVVLQTGEAPPVRCHLLNLTSKTSPSSVVMTNCLPAERAPPTVEVRMAAIYAIRNAVTTGQGLQTQQQPLGSKRAHSDFASYVASGS